MNSAHGAALAVLLGYPLGYSTSFQILLDKEDRKNNRLIELKSDGPAIFKYADMKPKYIHPDAIIKNINALLPLIVPPNVTFWKRGGGYST